MVDADAVAAALQHAAAAAILPRFRALAPGDVDTKAGGEIVTKADTDAEALLAPALTALLPGSVAIGEESCARDPRLRAALLGEAPVWIIDPVDGTRNFAAGIERFCTIVALARRGETVFGAILAPVTGELVVAEPGAGAWLGGARLRVSESKPLNACRGLLNERLFPGLDLAPMRRLAAALAETPAIRSMGLEHVALARGAAEISAYGRLDPWDHAAGVLIHAEAGGRARLIDGGAYGPRVSGGVLLSASDEGTWRDAAALLEGY